MSNVVEIENPVNKGDAYGGNTAISVAQASYTGSVYIPIFQAHAVFADLPPAYVPPEIANFVSPELWTTLNALSTFQVRQHVKILPKHCCTCPPCVVQENTYSVYGGFSHDAQKELLRIDEVSNDWNRCCCKPYHPLRLEVRQYIPVPGDESSGEFDHLAGDTNHDWNRLTGRDRAVALRELYKQQPPMFSMVRDNGQRCIGFPCKCLATFVCCECCQDGLHIYGGGVQDTKGEEGNPNNLPEENFIASVIQPIYGGCYRPQLDLRKERDDKSKPFGKLSGPCLFGGCSEFCCDFEFFASKYDSPYDSGDLAKITKVRAKGVSGMIKEAATDADNYSIEFNPDAQLGAAEKLSLIGAQVLTDYMIFDGNTEKCKCTNEGLYIYCFYCAFIGKVCPCCIFIPRPRN